MNTAYSRIIIGGGAVGYATAYWLGKMSAQKGASALLLEQFEFGHTRGSSHGSARITRHSYLSPLYSRLMPKAYRAWAELEADAGERIFVRTGGLMIVPASEAALIAKNLHAISVPFEHLSGADVRHKFSQFRAADEDEAVFEPDAGALLAERILAVERELALKSGHITIKDRTPVRSLELEGEKPVVVTEDGQRYQCDRVVVAAGSWVLKLLPRFAATLVPSRQQVLYFRANNPQRFMPESFPVFIVHPWGKSFYGIPMLQDRAVKIALHDYGGEVDPDRIDRNLSPDYEKQVRSFLSSYLPELADAPLAKSEVCLYTLAPDNHFVLGPLPEHPRVVVASACSGHGFKLSILTGRYVAELLVEGESALAQDCWAIPPERGVGAP